MYYLKYRVTKMNDMYRIAKVSIQAIYHDMIQSPIVEKLFLGLSVILWGLSGVYILTGQNSG